MNRPSLWISSCQMPCGDSPHVWTDMNGHLLKPDRDTSCNLCMHRQIELIWCWTTFRTFYYVLSRRPCSTYSNNEIYLGVSNVTVVFAGDRNKIWMSPRRCDVNVIFAWTCSKKLTPLQCCTVNWSVTWLFGGIDLNLESQMHRNGSSLSNALSYENLFIFRR